MAPPAGTLRVRRYFLALLAIFAVLYLVVFWPGQRHTPKLGTDLAGGWVVTFTAKTEGGGSPPADNMAQAREIMSKRVNGSGVTEATVVVQGSDKLVVTIPGKDAPDLKQLGAASQLNMRGLIAPATATGCISATAVSDSSTSPSGSAAPSASTTGSAAPSPTTAAPASAAPAKPNDAGHTPLAAPSQVPTTSADSATPTGTAAPSGAAAPSSGAAPSGSSTGTPAAVCSKDAMGSVLKSDANLAKLLTPCASEPSGKRAACEKGLAPVSSTVYTTGLTDAQMTEVSLALSTFDCATAADQPDVNNRYYVACDSSNHAYLLGPTVVPGSEISTAAAQAPNSARGLVEWAVSLDFKSTGAARWADFTSQHNVGGTQSGSESPYSCGSSSTPCPDFVAFTLDGTVISAPVTISTINGGSTQISGSFDQDSANDLANQLKYGALPLTFEAQNPDYTSATLGSKQLRDGLIAGGIGLILVIIYSLIYYRLLGLVTIASLIISGALVWGSLVMLGNQMNLTLSLPGIAGFVVAIGITADSFVVFFERLKDEVHDGRSARVAVPRAWVRARRTILSADTVSFLAAAILYYFTSDAVRGFAFTLGLSTLLDLIVVFLFTHPLVSLLSRSRLFGSKAFTGLDAVRIGGIGGIGGVAAPPRRRRRVKVGASGGGGRAGTAVLTDEDDEFVDDDDFDGDFDDELVDELADEELIDESVDQRAVDEAVADETDEPVAETADEPVAETAAQRAAARRARQRAEQQKKGDS